MKILLTGSSGFLGKQFFKQLSGNQEVLTLGRSDAYYIADLVKEVPLFDTKFDCIIHTAGKAHIVPSTEAEKNTIFQTNVDGTIHLLKGLEQVGLPERFVFISSVSVYGVAKGEMINEEAPLLAKDPYGLSKIQAEKVVSDWCAKNNVLYTILRLPLIAGANPPGNLKNMIEGIRKKYYFNIDGGLSKKSMVLDEDIAEYILIASSIGGIYNLTDGYHPSFYELSHYIANQLKIKGIPDMPLGLAKLIARTGDILGNIIPINTDKLNKINTTLTFDDSKAREAFGWKPTPVLKGFKIS